MRELTPDGYPVYGANGQIGFYTRFTHEFPTILITCRGATCGTINLCAPKSYVTGNAMALDALDTGRVDQRYLYRYLQWRRLDDVISGTAQPQITREGLRKVSVLLPSLTEQRRIADILDRAEALRAKRRTALASLDELTRSLFREMFGDPVSNPKGFKTGTIDDVVGATKGDVRCGPFGTQLKVHEIVSKGIPLLGIENVLNNKFVGQSSKFLTPAKARELAAFDVKSHDVLITRMGTIGRACVVPTNFEEGRFSYHLFRIRPDQTKCLSAFLSATISDSGTFQSQLQSMSHGAIMAGLNTTDLRRVKFLIPPIHLQQEFARRVEAIDQLKSKHRQSLAEMDALILSLQHRAFRGEL